MLAPWWEKGLIQTENIHGHLSHLMVFKISYEYRWPSTPCFTTACRPRNVIRGPGDKIKETMAGFCLLSDRKAVRHNWFRRLMANDWFPWREQLWFHLSVVALIFGCGCPVFPWFFWDGPMIGFHGKWHLYAYILPSYISVASCWIRLVSPESQTNTFKMTGKWSK